MTFIFSFLAHADIPPVPPDDKQFASNYVLFDTKAGLEDKVIVGYEPGKTSSSNLIINSEFNDYRSFSSTYEFALLSKEEFEVWRAMKTETVQKQRADCYDGIGCIHISRFNPKIPNPTGINCNFTLRYIHTVPMGEPGFLINIVQIDTATDDSCILSLTEVQKRTGLPTSPQEQSPDSVDNEPQSAPYQTPEEASTPAPSPIEEQNVETKKERGCSSVPYGEVLSFSILGLLFRRRGSQSNAVI